MGVCTLKSSGALVLFGLATDVVKPAQVLSWNIKKLLHRGAGWWENFSKLQKWHPIILRKIRWSCYPLYSDERQKVYARSQTCEWITQNIKNLQNSTEWKRHGERACCESLSAPGANTSPLDCTFFKHFIACFSLPLKYWWFVHSARYLKIMRQLSRK